MSKKPSKINTTEAAKDQMALIPAKIPKGRPGRMNVSEFKGIQLTGPKPSAQFVATVAAMGVIEPLIIFKPAEGRVRIGDGIRRIMAAQMTEQKDVPVVLYDDEENFRLAVTLIANNQRSANPLAEVRAIMRLQKKRFSLSQIAEATGLSRVRVEERLRLNNVIKPLYDAMFKGEIAVSIGAAASRLPVAFQKQLATQLKRDGKLTQKDVKEVKEVRRDKAVAALPAAIFADPPKPAALNGDERELLTAFITRYKAERRGEKKTLSPDVDATIERLLAKQEAARG